jgi:lysophospholipase L1-like esterase
VNGSVASLLWWGSALWLALGALLCGPSGLAWIAPFDEPLRDEVLSAARSSRAWLAAAAVACSAAGLWLRRRPPTPERARRLATALLPVALLLAPLAAAELALRPFLQQRSLLFMADDALGWRLIPGATGVWGGMPVRINAKGLRGPELSYAKPEGVSRILFLGDSVTFGYRVAHEDTFAFHAERRLNELGHDVEAINAGVGGYSPWQEHLYLEREGLRYQPDVVVIGFVLNDVTTKFGLVQFGGPRIAYQLRKAGGTRLARRSGLLWMLHQLRGLAAYGADPARGAAEAQQLDVETLVRRSDDPRLPEAWEITLDNLRAIVELCRARGAEPILVVFPYRFQLQAPQQDDPQQRLARFAAEQDLPQLDLLPALIAAARRDGIDPTRYFIDYDHLSPLGGRVVAQLIVDELLAHGLASRREPTRGSR